VKLIVKNLDKVSKIIFCFLFLFSVNNIFISYLISDDPLFDISLEKISLEELGCSANYGDYVPPSSGMWTITQDTRVENAVYSLNGSILISQNVALEIINSSFCFNIPHDQEFSITGNDNTSLIFKKSNISSSNGALLINMMQNSRSNFSVIGSTFSNLKSVNVINAYINSSKFYNFTESFLNIEKNRWNISISDSLFENCSPYAIGFTYAQNITINACKISKINGSGIIFTNCTNFAMFNTSIHTNDNTAQRMNGMDISNSQYYKCENVTVQNFMKNLFIRYTSNFLFKNCIFEYAPDGIPIDGEAQFVNCHNYTINNCTFRNLPSDNIEIYRGSNILIENNTFIESLTYFHFEYWPIRNITIRHNTILSGGSYIQHIDGMHIYNNLFQNCSMNIDNSVNIFVYNNTFDNPCKITFDSNVTNGIIENNVYISLECDDDNGNDDPDERGDDNNISGFPIKIFLTLGSTAVLLKLYHIKKSKLRDSD
jgi:hypothetical protein